MTKMRGKNNIQGSILVDHVEQFALLKRASMAETSRLREFFYALVFHTNKEQKRRIAMALARSVYTPRSILIFLSLEQIDVASPVLLFSLAINDIDLQNVIRKTSLDHARVIARRDNINRETIDLLIERDDTEQTVWKILQQNNTIRESLPKAAPVANMELRKEISPAEISGVKPAKQAAPQSVKPAAPVRDLGYGLVELANKGNRLRQEKKRKSANPARREFARELGEVLIAAGREGDMDQVSRTIKETCGLSIETTLGYIRGQDIGTFACLLYALDISNVAAGRIMLLIFPALGQDSDVFSKVMAHYKTLERPKVIAFFITKGAFFDLDNRPAPPKVQPGAFDKLVENRRQSVQRKPAAEAPGDRRPEYPRFAMASG